MKPPQSIWLFKNLLSSCYCYGQLHNSPLPSVAKKISYVMRLHSCGFWRPESLLDTDRFTLSFHGWLRKKHQDSRALWKHEAVQKYLETLSKEYQQVDHLLNADSKNEFEQRTLRRRRADLSPVATAFQEIREAESELQELETMCRELDSRDEKQLLELALEEKETLDKKINTLCRKLFQLLVPKEKYDKSHVILEVTAGRTTGGDICQQFTKEMFEMYQNYADYKCWTFDILNYVPAEIGGLHHAAAHISGDDVYRHLKYEGGTHRVQRIPETGLSSRMQRIHTGTMSVIVLPQPEEVDVKVDPKDLRIDTFRAKGAGGQHVNKTDSAVRIVHLPTGVVVECQQERSQQMNKEIALRTLRAKLYQQIIEKQLSQEQSARKLQLGTRAQSERIRTYNFTQDRVTDHRISYDARNIKEILSGKEELDKLINRLLEFAEMEALTEYLENLQSVGGEGC
ncbi:peptide chain release factor 1, mitochondrial isoform X3 [Gallus gallus]|nr:peptide chain release factor 1, mitochondrial isoform X3 [Gallus gallus]XP_015132279.1 peptide chain release factor 1, mitochondrial isoform X3 [Gallus gallus]XP_046755292.1 peptide chain release factor 1, mitochondrial isoform X3 [Gallus gallus]XP_046755297.1 peptide chain release factor 1, mitochondrial isoform X3 [Gallus gallus]XP_046755307.1 peptide chain release factor 1, mitochondrial isoform X3 [Gallus gallus]XP_046755310.1 peptide chain release factor 1, mitochondrial isoform X3 [Ga|eukprot:XP_004938721.1 peptide chain release factor 1, mitochondrial isoform X3 [Gallus gallus]